MAKKNKLWFSGEDAQLAARFTKCLTKALYNRRASYLRAKAEQAASEISIEECSEEVDKMYTPTTRPVEEIVESKLMWESIGDLKPYCLQLDTSRAMQYKRLLEQADRYKQMELPLEHPKESTTYMGIAIANLALAYRLSGSEQYLQDAKRFMNTVLSYEKWGNAHLVNVD